VADAVMLTVVLALATALIMTLVFLGATVAGHRQDMREVNALCFGVARQGLDRKTDAGVLEQLDRSTTLIGAKFDQAMESAMAVSGDAQEMVRKRLELTAMELRARELAEMARTPAGGRPAERVTQGEPGGTIEATRFSDTDSI
jgi:hypothetical protein